MDRDYFRLLWNGFRLDRSQYRRARREARRLARALRKLRREIRRGAAAEVGILLDAARRHLRARMALHRFPGVKLVGAFKVAIKGLHYEKVMRSVTSGGAGPPR